MVEFEADGCSGAEGLLVDGSVVKPDSWTPFVNGAETEAELKALRQSVERGTPFGGVDWQVEAAGRLGLESSLPPLGRLRLDRDA
ncbi:hypothetical protein [Schlesneria sp. T3-172]|uniref:hypothetical protein n=1 Tax=Schlesneria sphaerica TaxID=3373610 RepID=UPI0037C72408